MRSAECWWILSNRLSDPLAESVLRSTSTAWASRERGDTRPLRECDASPAPHAVSRLDVRALRNDERGTVSAEFAVALPAVLVVLALVIGGVVLASHKIVLTSAAADIVRLESRGDSAIAQQRIAELGSGVTVQRERRGPLLCLTLRASPAQGPLSRLGVGASACAARSEAAEDAR